MNITLCKYLFAQNYFNKYFEYVQIFRYVFYWYTQKKKKTPKMKNTKYLKSEA